MFGLGTSRLLAFVFICTGTRAQGQSITSTALTLSGSTSRYANETVDEAVKSKNSSERQYLVEYSDYMDVPNFKKHESGRFDYYNFVQDLELNDTFNNTKLVINKCCSWNFYFDTDIFKCVRFQENFRNSTESDLFINKIQNRGNGSHYAFVKNSFRCDRFSVLSIQIVPKTTINFPGIILDGNRLFSEYCIDDNPKYPNKTIVLGCSNAKVFCKSHRCFRKCCPFGESYGLSGRTCQKTENPFKPEFYNLTTLMPDDSVKLSHFGIYLGDSCEFKGKYLLEKEFGEISYLGVDGSLYVPMYGKSFSDSDYCVEYVTSNNKSWIGSFLCFSKTGNSFENSQLQFFLLSLGFIISCMFLMLTFLVYLFSPKSQNLYGKTLMCYIACLFTAYLCLAVVELKSGELSKIVCTNMGYALLFSFLAAFFWLNVMSFDIWKTFRVYRTVERSETDKARIQFFRYSLYAWSFPSAITAACAVINQMEDFPIEFIKPAIGEDHCWFSKRTKGIYVFFISPISLVIICNIIFYVQTALKISKVKSDVKRMESQRKKFSANKNQFMINGKLFIVMGITWSLEIISFFAPHPIWYITDTANALHGVFIFAIFVLKKKVIQQVSQRFRLPLTKMKILSNSNSEEQSTKKNFRDSNTEGKTLPTCSTPISMDYTKT